eukprot:1140086-Pelagomonas_calceolata.AAC.5
MNKMQMLNSTSQRFASNKALGLTPKALTPRSSLPGAHPYYCAYTHAGASRTRREVSVRAGEGPLPLVHQEWALQFDECTQTFPLPARKICRKAALGLWQGSCILFVRTQTQAYVTAVMQAIRGGSQSDLLVVCSFPPSSEQIWGGAQRGRAGVITPEHCTTDISVLALQLFSSKCAGTDSNACAVHVTAMCVGWMAAGADCEGAAPGEKYTGHGSPEPCYSRTCGWHHHGYWCHWGCGQARGGQDAAGGEACACARARFPEGPGAAGEAACTWFLSISVCKRA